MIEYPSTAIAYGPSHIDSILYAFDYPGVPKRTKIGFTNKGLSVGQGGVFVPRIRDQTTGFPLQHRVRLILHSVSARQLEGEIHRFLSPHKCDDAGGVEWFSLAFEELLIDCDPLRKAIDEAKNTSQQSPKNNVDPSTEDHPNDEIGNQDSGRHVGARQTRHSSPVSPSQPYQTPLSLDDPRCDEGLEVARLLGFERVSTRRSWNARGYTRKGIDELSPVELRMRSKKSIACPSCKYSNVTPEGVFGKISCASCSVVFYADTSLPC